MERELEPVSTYWKQVSKERHNGYDISINTCQIDVGIIMLTLIEKDGVLVDSHETVMTHPKMQKKA